MLRAHGVRHIFTLVGGHISPILVECKRRDIRVIDVRHEVNAVFAADAVSRITGVPGVAAVTAGPGVTNTITAIKNAQLAQSPLVLIGGATATMLRGRGSLQDIDQMALIRPHVKYAARPNTLREVVPALEEAFRIAQTGVPGPVFVELAVDLLYDEATVRQWYKAKTDKPNKKLVDHALSTYIKGHLAYVFAGASNPNIPRPQPAKLDMPPKGSVKEAAKQVAKAERPVLVIGSQAMLRQQRVAELVTAVERIGIPVYLSGMARGLMGQGHRLHFRHKRSKALEGSDLVILAGVPCDFRMDYGSPLSRTTVISVNLSEHDLKKNRKPDQAVLADPHTFLVKLSQELAPRERTSWMTELRDRDAGRDGEIQKMGDEKVDYCNPLEVCQSIDRHLDDESLMVGDGGDFVATASYIVRPRKALRWLDPGVFGTLGVGAGFAIGAKAALPDTDVWILYGDGAAGFSMLELDTCARHGLNVIAVIGNDAGWTQIERDQVEILGDDVACRLEYMDYHVVAEGCGAKGLKVDAPDQLDAAFDKALELSRGGSPVCINALIGKTDFRKGSISM